jgi:serpin B
MKIISPRLLSFVVLPLFLFSCKKDQVEQVPLEPVKIDLTSDQITLIDSGNSFAFDLFRKTAQDADKSENIIISPLSISVALSMTMNGADGATRDAMAEALRANGLSSEDINSSYKKLTETLLSVDKRVLINIANSVWIEQRFPVKKQFTDILTQYYNADTKSFNVEDPGAPADMNNWIEDKTNGLIKDMIESLDPQSAMLLINAIYFKGKWNSQFEKSKTINMPFHKQVGVVADVPMMKQKNEFKSYKGDGFMLGEFPYGQGNYVMDVILPDNIDGVDDIIQSTDNVSFNSIINHLHQSEIDLSFPKFKYGYKKQLNNILSDMGMGVAFTEFADFSKISDLALMIGFVLHQAFIETNEEGTEAAAATVVGMYATSLPADPIEMNIDHPFFYIIRETTTNTILFMGKVADPSAK